MRASKARAFGFLSGVAALAFTAMSAVAEPVSLPYMQTFDTDIDAANFFNIYSEFTAEVSGGGEIHPSVQDGILRLPPVTPTGVYSLSVTPDPLPEGAIILDIDGGNAAGGGNQFRFRVGFNAIIFHPGYDAGGPTQGAFRIDGPGGFPNVALPFLPAVGSLYHLHVVLNPDGSNSVQLSDPNNAGNVFNTSWTSASAHNGPFGPAWFFGQGIYDNFSITTEGGGGGLAADFDHDGDVDGDDLNNVWKPAFGQNANGDANGDTQTDGTDFLVWQQQLGSTAPPVSAIPEPCCVALVIMGALARVARRRR